MQVTATMVKALRERTGAGMMECKAALVNAQGDIEAAIEDLRKAGAAKDDKRAAKVAADGTVVVAVSSDGVSATLVEVNCETDFVAKGEDFQGFARALALRVLNSEFSSVDELSEAAFSEQDSRTVNVVRQELVAKVGEKVAIRRFERITADAGVIGHYSHGNRIAVMLALRGGDSTLAKDIAMHIAASAPLAISEHELPVAALEREREIISAQAAQTGRPADIVEKIISGKLKKYMAENTLLGQSFVKDPEQTVAKLLSSKQAEVTAYVRYAVGEGIEKEQANFADEVMAQAKGG